MSDRDKPSLFDRLREGLEESIAYSKGELSLVTTELPTPPPKPKPSEEDCADCCGQVFSR